MRKVQRYKSTKSTKVHNVKNYHRQAGLLLAVHSAQFTIHSFFKIIRNALSFSHFQSSILNLQYSIFNLDTPSVLAMQGRVVAWKGRFISMQPRLVFQFSIFNLQDVKKKHFLAYIKLKQ